jgi:hypothetical protein
MRMEEPEIKRRYSKNKPGRRIDRDVYPLERDDQFLNLGMEG